MSGLLQEVNMDSDSLRSHLNYNPRELRFGTSGRRGEVEHLTQLEVYVNVVGELMYLQSCAAGDGGIALGEEFYWAYDLRPSSSGFVSEGETRGEICQAMERAVLDAGMQSVNLGRIPTPALAYYALSRHKGSIMVTGSHIPFDQNGYKLNTSRGEVLKKDEEAITQTVQLVRERIYAQAFSESLFNERGMLKEGHRGLTAQRDDAKSLYIRRYLDFFAGSFLANKRVVVYQHSAVGRDLLVEILESIGAEVIPMGRTETFVPIDTENIDAAQIDTLQMLHNDAAQRYGSIWAVVSTDGDSDRPLIVGVDPHTSAVRFFGGDLAGMIAAEYLGADSVVVPISCNDGIDRGSLAQALEPKTRIGSPFVIAGLEKARGKGRKVICGWEANGGFLTASDIQRNGNSLSQLCTRDAILPILCVLFAAHEKNMSLVELFSRLPRRFSRAALLKRFSRAISRRIVEKFSLEEQAILDVVFETLGTKLFDRNEVEWEGLEGQRLRAESIRSRLHEFFEAGKGFGQIVRLNYIDGVRITFSSGEVAHFRPSGNADELRIYAVADTQERADSIAQMAVAEPNGILRLLEKSVIDRGT
jgi:phosphomannomutase